MNYSADNPIEKASEALAADAFIFNILKSFYTHLREHGLEVPLTHDKWINPNPLKTMKFYNSGNILLVNYMLNEELIAAKIGLTNPLLIHGSITQKGLDYLHLESIIKI